MLVAHLGLVIFFFNWVALAVLLVGFVPAVIARILVEEKLLFRASGYSHYARRRKRLLPFIW
jgi:protein-S-isoprenylcysteine O-methyltransferase Ste14